MIGSLLMPIFALVGFIGFESLKVYKRLWAGLAPIPKRRVEYFSVLIPVAVFVAGTALAMDPDSAMKAVFMGFSIPASVKAIFDPISKDASSSGASSDPGSHQDHVEDIEVSKKVPIDQASKRAILPRILRYYFSS